ncbi:MAG TPA: hypothetical protein VJ801_14645 [Polyangia bacterium]|jgi:hypothetical protein|nr:hypothetical protein [Polyangia bacterium]
MGPITLPNLPRKRRWVWPLVCTLLGFAAGVAAGPTLTSHALMLGGRASSSLGMSAPKAGQVVAPVAATPTPAPAGPSIELLPSPSPGGEEAPVAEERAQVPAADAEPIAARAEGSPGRDRTAGAVAPHGRPAEAPVARSPHTKSEARTPSAKAAPTRTTASAQPAASAPGGFRDPFADGAGSASEPKAAAPGRKFKPSLDEFAPTAKSEPAPKPAVSTSNDPLANLMAEVVTDTKGKDKHREGKGLDAMLQDVQKSKPEPAPKGEAPASLPPLSQADISRVMAGVKARGKDCARELGQKGIAELKLTVSKGGNVTDVKVGGKLANTPVGACIEKAARTASFPRSAGLRFDYGIDVR